MAYENWREAIEALRAELWKMKQENLDLQNELVKLRRTYDDQIYNLDLDNMPRVKKIALQTDDGVAGLVIRIDNTESEVKLLAQRQTEQGSSIANIDAKADANSAQIHQVALVQEEHEKSMAEIEQTAEENAAEMKLIVEVQTEQGKSIASVDEKATENAASIEQVARVQTEQGESIAAVKQDVEGNSASIEQVAKTQSEQGESLARVEQKASENTASIEQVAMVQTEQGESIASIDAKVDENSSTIRLEVQRVGGVAAEAVEKANNAENTAEEANARASNGAYIIASINDDGSVIKIRADKLELSGYATFASLENEGETTINGANLKTGTVDADVLKTGGVGQTGTALGNNLMFNAGVEKYSDAEARYLFFVDPTLYNVFIGVEGGTDAKILRIHSEGNGLFDSYGGERLYLGSIIPGNEFVTRSEAEDMISAALGGGDAPVTIYAPKISPSSGDYAMPVTVEITNYNSTGDVYYTISGAGSADGTYLYTGPFDIYDTVEDYVTVSAFCRTDHGDSEEASVTYYLSA